MPLSTTEAVTETYRLALQQSVQSSLKTEQEWDRYTEIAKDAAERIDEEREAFRTDYQARLTEARTVVLREQQARALEHPKPSWAADTPPSAEKIDLVARNRVLGDHERRIATIRTDEVDQYQSLKDDLRARDVRQSHAREQHQGHAKDAFNLTNQVSPLGGRNRTRSGPSQT